MGLGVENGKCYFASIPTEQLTWLALGEDQAARSRRVEQLTAL